MRGAQPVDVLARCRIERRRDARGGIGAHVLVRPIAGRRGDEQRDGVGVADHDGIAAGAARSSAWEHADASFEAQCAGHGTAVYGGRGAVAVDAAHHEVAARRRLHRCALRGLHPRLERDVAGAAGRQPHDDDLVGRAREHLARERHATGGVGHVSRSGGEVEIAPVVLYGIDLRKSQREIADRLVRHLRERLRHHFRVDELRRVAVLALREQAPDIGKRIFRVGVHRIVRPARPQRVLVQLQPLVDDAAEDHRAETAVAHR